MISISEVPKKRGRPRKKFENLDEFIAYETDCDVLNSLDENEIPPSPKLKRPDDLQIKKENKVVLLHGTDPKLVAASEFLQSSALHQPLLGTLLLSDDLPDSEFVVVGGYVSKFTKPRMINFLQIIREGLSVVRASKLVGMDPEIVQKAIEENRYNLRTCVEVAKEEHFLFHVKRVNNAEYGHQCSSWMLERKYREEFGREVKITNGADGPKQKVKFGNREIEF